VADVTPTPAFELVVNEMMAALSAQTGFDVLSHTLDVSGHCRDCR